MNRCPYCHEGANETVKLLYIDEKENCASQAYIWNDQLHIEVVYPNIDYPMPQFGFYQNFKINYCPMCGRKLTEE